MNLTELKASLLTGDDLLLNADGSENKNKIKVLETVFDNMTSQESPHWDRAFPLVRRILPNLLANEIAGIQALKKIEDDIYTLRVGYSEPNVVPHQNPDDEENDKQQINNVVLSILSDSSSKSLLKARDELYKVAMTKKVYEAKATEGNRLNVIILKEKVVAAEKKLNVRFDLEIGKEIENEIFDAISSEIVYELDYELMSNLQNIAKHSGSTPVFDMGSMTGTPTFVGDVHAALAILINRQANLIAARTRRSVGNKLIVSPTALVILLSATSNAFTRVKPDFKSPYTKFVGTLNKHMNVYVNQYAPDNEPVVVLYKGSSEMDGPVFFNPFLPIKLAKVNNCLEFYSEYNYHELQNTPTSLGNALDYVSSVGINTDTLTFV